MTVHHRMIRLRVLGVLALTTVAATASAAQNAGVDPARIDSIFAFANSKSPGCAGLFVLFRRDSKGAIVALEASAGERARHIRFDRQR